MERPITIDAVRLYNYTHMYIAAGLFLHDQKDGQELINIQEERRDRDPFIIARNILLLLYAQVDG